MHTTALESGHQSQSLQNPPLIALMRTYFRRSALKKKTAFHVNDRPLIYNHCKLGLNSSFCICKIKQ